MSVSVEITIRLNPHAKYLPTDSDAICCPYDMEGFTVMNAMITAHRFDHDHFQRSARWHEIPKFRAISHGHEKPFVITTTKYVPWADREISPAKEIMRIANIERCESLCITHFAYIVGEFPEKYFTACVRQIIRAPNYKNLKKVVVDVDSNYASAANNLYEKIRCQESIKRHIMNMIEIFKFLKKIKITKVSPANRQLG